jgi:hypothetical protein
MEAIFSETSSSSKVHVLIGLLVIICPVRVQVTCMTLKHRQVINKCTVSNKY